MDKYTKCRLIIRTYLLIKGKATTKELANFINKNFNFRNTYVTARTVGVLLKNPAPNSILYGVKKREFYSKEFHRSFLEYYFEENKELVSDLNHQLEVSKALRYVVKSLETENTQLRKDLIDYSAVVQMLESCTGLSIEDILYNKTGAESQEEFDKIHKTYHDKAKQWWGKEE